MQRCKNAQTFFYLLALLWARFYKSTATGAMAGGLKDFGGTKELDQLFGPPKAGRTKELGGPKCKSKQTDKEGHFIRGSSNVKTWLVSKAVDSKLKCPPKLLVMSQDK